LNVYRDNTQAENGLQASDITQEESIEFLPMSEGTVKVTHTAILIPFTPALPHRYLLPPAGSLSCCQDML